METFDVHFYAIGVVVFIVYAAESNWLLKLLTLRLTLLLYMHQLISFLNVFTQTHTSTHTLHTTSKNNIHTLLSFHHHHWWQQQCTFSSHCLLHSNSLEITSALKKVAPKDVSQMQKHWIRSFHFKVMSLFKKCRAFRWSWLHSVRNKHNRTCSPFFILGRGGGWRLPRRDTHTGILNNCL